MAATLGMGADRLIARASAVRMSDAVILQAVAAAMIETCCDEVNEAVQETAEQEGAVLPSALQSRLRRFFHRASA